MAKLRRALIASFMGAMGLAASFALASDVSAPAHEINITTDSAPGWLPSLAMLDDIQKRAFAYFSSRDGGHLEDAYRLFADIHRQHLPFAEYSTYLRDFNAKAGAVVERRIVKITWTKDPAQAPAPGIYAALDMVSRFANADRHCGYLILYQPPTGGAFGVMREEESYLDNNSAQQIEREHSRGDVDKLWAQLSAHCPNYPGK